MRACVACQTETEDSGKYCPACGSSLELAARISHDIATDSTAQVTAVARTSELVQNSASTSLVGTTIDGFAIESILGGGAFGTVYRGTQVGLDRAVAFKVPTLEMAGDSTAARRFAREARSAARVDHPGVVTIYAVGELDDGRPYLAMQYIDGRELDTMLETVDGRVVPVAPLRALHIARQIASALSETHAMDVVHRDLKPSNIVWRRDRNGDDHVTLVDFGIAVCKPGNADATRLTGANLIGTPHYMAPEQAQGDDVDGRTDLYALGCILFELVTGETPFAGSGFEILLAHINKPIPVPSHRLASLPPAIDRVVVALLAKKPDERPATADAVVALLDGAIAELAAPPIPKSRVPIVAIAFAALTLAGVGVFELVHHHGNATPAPPAAEVADDNAPDPTLREIASDDGTFVCRVRVPETIRAKVPARTQIRVLSKFGEAIEAAEVVVTIEDTRGAATGYTARRRTPAGQPPYFGFRHAYPAPGHYVMRVFPPDSDSVFRFELDVTD